MRTTLLDANGRPKYTNRLLRDSSPYLVQHAHNPVDWYPWGEEAFAVAKRENKPIFLSVGYSTCHWCHVMERESFDNEEIAAFLNEHFVAIKLDREQRPDLDEIYMTGLQLMTGQGGWPMSTFITAEGKPFFAGTYFPPEGFLNLLEQIAGAWQNQQDEVLVQADQLAASIQQHSDAASQAAELDSSVVAEAIEKLLGNFDEVNGGFGQAPKFPNESQLWLLFEDAVSGSKVGRPALLKSLSKMAQGGLFDQIGGGFHRYSVDQAWLVPHFEKMLYNQAQLVRLYAAAYGLTGAAEYRRVLELTLNYLAREMTAADGSFYSATDADTEGEEGRFFIWPYSELQAILSSEELELATQVYGVSAAGNFEGANILHMPQSLTDFGDDPEWRQAVADLQEKLRLERDKRQPPFRDEKVIIAWNALLITSIAEIELLTGIEDYRPMAIAAAETLWQKQVQDIGQEGLKLWRSRLSEEVSIAGTLEDYAYFAEAALHLALLGEADWLRRAEQLLRCMLDQFWDDEEGGFYSSLVDSDGPMLVRTKNPLDTAMPSGNSVALSALQLAFDATGKPVYKQHRDKTLATFAQRVQQNPLGHCYFLSVLQRIRQGRRLLKQWACEGRVYLELELELERSDLGAVLTITIAEGWHVNHPDAPDDLLGLLVSGAENAYPDPEWLKVDFAAEAIPVLAGKFTISLSRPGAQLKVRLQACSESVCLAPEVIHFALPETTRPNSH
ncbi:MAG: thioredoxin domain-containing protein [Pseudomonadales bacterium]